MICAVCGFEGPAEEGHNGFCSAECESIYQIAEDNYYNNRPDYSDTLTPNNETETR